MSAMLETEVAAAASYVVCDDAAVPEGVQTSPAAPPGNIVRELTANAITTGSRNKFTLNQTWALAGATASGILGDIDSKETGFDATRSEAAPLLDALLTEGQAAPAAFPVETGEGTRATAHPRSRKPRRARLQPPPREVEDPALALYRAKGIAAISVLLSDVQITTVERPDSVDQRGYSKYIEQKWLERVPDDYYVQFPDDQQARIVLPESETQWFDFAFVSEDGRTLWPVNMKAGKDGPSLRSAGDVAGIHALRYLLEGQLDERFSVPATSRQDLSNLIGRMRSGMVDVSMSPRDYFLLHYNYDTGDVRTASMMSLLDEHFKPSATNNIQVAVPTAKYELGRPMSESMNAFLNAAVEMEWKTFAPGAISMGFLDDLALRDRQRRDALVDLVSEFARDLYDGASTDEIVAARERFRDDKPGFYRWLGERAEAEKRTRRR